MERTCFATPVALLLGATLAGCDPSPSSPGVDRVDRIQGLSSSSALALAASTDVTPPSAPRNLAWTSADLTVTLDWQPSTDVTGVVGYELYYGSYDLGGFTDTSVALIGFKAGTPYTFTVKARDAAGNVSAASNAITVLLGIGQDTVPPSAPTNVTAGSVTSSSVSLRWTASADDVGVVVYQVYMGGALSATVTSPSATITRLSPSTTYGFTVTALDAAGNASSPSGAVSVTTAADSGLDACMTSSGTSPSGFGVTDGGSSLTVNSGTGLVYVVSKSDGSITSIKWKGTELNDASKGSHVASGLGSATVTSTIANGVVLVTATAVNTIASSGTVIQYLATRQNENTIYLATYTTAEPSVGELRWITRLRGNILTGVPAQSNNSGNSGAIESSDVFGHPDGTTTSKYYGNQRAKDLSIRGVTGAGVGVFMIYGSRETSSGGPFFKDIQNQSDTAADAELYNYMNSGHNQTEAWRTGLHGPYALRFTNGCTPSIPDLGWMSSLGLTGWVSARGSVTGSSIAGRDTRYPYLVALSNSTAQYWADADGSTGAFTSPAMIPGAYDVTVYKGELGVWTGAVTVTAGATTTLAPITITADPSSVAAVWRIGDWDGTPLELDNGTNIGLMHPQDPRMNGWGPVTYTVGGSSASSFPAVQFRGANTPTTVKFALTSGQLTAHTVKIGITSAYGGGRPIITVNGWSSSTPAVSTQPSSRSITIGTYRGNDQTYTYSVPASAFVVGTNTLTINVASGSSDLGTWLSAGWGYDCVELD